MTVSTFFPDPHEEVTSVDGFARENTDADWTTMRDAAGDAAFDTLILANFVQAAGTTDVWTAFGRSILLFDTSALPDDDSIDSATMEFVGTFINDDFSDSISLVTSTPASNTAVVAGDYAQLGTTKQAADLTLASLTVDDSTYNPFTLNATGRSSISKTGVSKFGMRMTSDVDDVEPTWSANALSDIDALGAEEAGTSTDPKLVVTHTGVSADSNIVSHSQHLILPGRTRVI